MSRSSTNKQQGWRWAFLFLLLPNIVMMVGLARALTTPVDYTSMSSPPTDAPANHVTATAILGAGDLELLVQGALDRYEEAEKLTVGISDRVELEGLFTVWGLDIPYLLRGEPFVTESGDLQVKVDNINLGSLTLPNQQALSLIASQLDPSLPITVNSQEEWFTIHVTHIQAEKGLALRLLQIDKETQEYKFALTLPRENLLQ